LTQEYSISVTQNDAGFTDDSTAVVTVTEAGVQKAFKEFSVPLSGSDTITFNRAGGLTDDRVSVVIKSGGMLVTSITKTIYKDREQFEENVVEASTNAPKVDEYYSPYNVESFCRYSSSSLGTTLLRQVHRATVTLSETSRVVIVAVDEDDTFRSFEEYDLPSGTYTITTEHDGGSWDTMTKVNVAFGSIIVSDISKTLYYTDNIIDGTKTLQSTSSARMVIGSRITVNADFAVDKTGDYGGVDTLIEEPGWVIKHFLVNELGYDKDADIDTTTFSAASTSYGTLSYTFGFIWNGQDVQQMAAEARSTLKFVGGKWYLSVTPDTAPAATKTIANTELAGKDAMFVFEKGSVFDIENDITGTYFKTETTPGVVTDSDSTSITKYGTYKGEYSFDFIRLEAMASNVIAHYLLRNKVPLIDVEFDLFYEHFDLAVGDTFDITNPLFTGNKFWVEEIRRDKAIMKVKGKGWW
jgi:hypothetical protein